jgi:phage terminase large subunit-like protein
MIQKTDIKTFSKLFILENSKSIQLEPWQTTNIVEPVFYTLNKDGNRKYNLALCGMPKKNGKSTLSALTASYMLLADGENEPEVYGAAGGKDQAKIIFSQTVKAIQRSPILANEVNIYRDIIERKDGKGFYKVLSADAPLQHGLNPYCVVFDELWNNTYDLWEALTHSPARKQPLHFCVTYAGYQPWEGNLLYDLYLRGKSKKDPHMWFFWTNKNNASWVTPKYLKQQRDRLPEHIYRRLHMNEWTTGSGTFLSKDDVQAAVDPNLSQQFKGKAGISYHLALDLGLRRDRTCVSLIHKDPVTGKVILDHLKLFEAPKNGEVKVEDVEEHILQLATNFNIRNLIFDPWQSVRTRQRLESYGLNIEEFTFSGSNWVKLTQNLLSLFKDRQISIFENSELIKELLSVKILERNYGYRIDHQSGAHDDCVVSVGMAALQTVKIDGLIFPELAKRKSNGKVSNLR